MKKRAKTSGGASVFASAPTALCSSPLDEAPLLCFTTACATGVIGIVVWSWPPTFASARRIGIGGKGNLRCRPCRFPFGDSWSFPSPAASTSFLDQLPQLAAGLERRAHKPKQRSVIEIGLTNYPGQSDRIAALVEDCRVNEVGIEEAIK